MFYRRRRSKRWRWWHAGVAIGDFVCGICVSLVSGVLVAILSGFQRFSRSLRRSRSRQASGNGQVSPETPTGDHHPWEWDPEVVDGTREALVQLGHSRPEASRMIELTMASTSTHPSSIEALIREIYRTDAARRRQTTGANLATSSHDMPTTAARPH